MPGERSGSSLLEVTDPARIVAERLPEFGVASLASPVNLGFNYWFLVGKKGTVYNPYVLFPDSLLRTSSASSMFRRPTVSFHVIYTVYPSCLRGAVKELQMSLRFRV